MRQKNRFEQCRVHGYYPLSRKLGGNYDPHTCNGALAPPIFQTTTYATTTPEEMEEIFQRLHGTYAGESDTASKMDVYQRIGNSNVRNAEWDICAVESPLAKESVLFPTGMAAIATLFHVFTTPGDVVAVSTPLYGGAWELLHEYFVRRDGILLVPYNSYENLRKKIEHFNPGTTLSLIYGETPSNPTNNLLDIEKICAWAHSLKNRNRRVRTVFDNTFLGPVFMQPLEHGADMSLYSGTKFLGGHGDLMTGAIVGRDVNDIKKLRLARSHFGNTATPETASMLSMRLKTLHDRMRKQQHNAKHIARMLAKHPHIAHVHYLDLLTQGASSCAQFDIYKRHCLGPGSMIGIEFFGGKKEAFAFMRALAKEPYFELAVSLGSTDSKYSHPRSSTHSGVSDAENDAMGVTEGLVRLSIGTEPYQALRLALANALANML